MSLWVLRVAGLVTVQDLGRPGWAHLGVPRSGALDAPALRLANRLVGNPESAAGLELTLAGGAVRAGQATVVALTGAPAPLRVAGRPAPYGAAVPVPTGSLVEVGPAVHGLRSYLAFAGGIEVPAVLGSRATDTLSGIGPAPLVAGEILPLGIAGAGHSAADFAPVPRYDQVVLRLWLGPRDDWFTPDAIGTLCGTAYQLSPRSNRVGARLSGGVPLGRARDGELPSEGMVLGAVQVPADGQPLVFLADHPTTGGYPVIGVVDPADLPALAQARPGVTSIRFRLR